jgi:urease gamma subunit
MALEAVIVVVGAIATVIGLAELAARLPIRRQPPAAPPPPRSRTTPSQLLRIERIVDRAGESGVAAHTLLRPLLVEIAEARLRRRGLRLEEDGAAALLGAAAWELVRPGRPAPHDRDAGVTRRELEHVLDRLEAL